MSEARRELASIGLGRTARPEDLRRDLRAAFSAP